MKAFLVECRTGCSCCSEENHVRGPFSTEEIALAKVEAYRAIPLLASQYARSGNYQIHEEEAEQLPDGRLIIDFQVYSGFKDDTTPGGDDYARHQGY